MTFDLQTKAPNDVCIQNLMTFDLQINTPNDIVITDDLWSVTFKLKHQMIGVYKI